MGTWDNFVKIRTKGPKGGGPKGKVMGTREKTIVGVKKVVYRMAQEASASAFVPKATKRKILPVKASTSRKRKSHIVTIEEGSTEVSPVSQEPTLNPDKGKFVD